MWKPNGYFDATAAKSVVTPPWPVSTSAPMPIAPVIALPDNQAYRNDYQKKRQFGIELSKTTEPFEAGLKVFGKDTSAALWVSQNWLNDPVVIEARVEAEAAVKVAENLPEILDKKAFAFRVLAFVDEKDLSGKFLVNEGKDRLAALRLYGEVAGYIGKNADSNQPVMLSNEMRIVLVSPSQDENTKIIDDVKPISNNVSEFRDLVKLVG